MRLSIALAAAIAVLALAACSAPDDSAHRGQSGTYIGGMVGGSM